MEGEIQAFVAAKAGPEKSMKRSGYALAILIKKKSVSWKDAFITQVGITAAKLLEAGVGSREVLEVKKL